MFRNLFLAALLAAFCAGLVTSAFQFTRLVPLILEAEQYEGEAHAHDHAHEDEGVAHSHDEDEWMPEDGFERTAYTVLANFLLAAGFAFVIAAVSVIFNLPLTPMTGVLWGVGGFIAFSLAPSLGLPPGLPGMPVADTGARQFWWVFAATATGAGLVLLAKYRAAWAIALAVALFVVPHLFGAPQPPSQETDVPAGLAAAFASNVLANGLVFWVVLGVTYGFANLRFSRSAR
ncbi:CbtA family protein [Pelagibacterium limicola]|uniref:CbtA family protein n=1 Tax=Pelagibacterium limicola TaxID=2791022 RepID=UPI0018AFFDA4|nr:CbtA family protein [Pelagibacterium limicola]